MNNKLIKITIMVVLLIVGISGCNELKNFDEDALMEKQNDTIQINENNEGQDKSERESEYAKGGVG